MKLQLEREASTLTCTPGSLFIDDVFECFTLEDAVREVPDTPVDQWKVKGETAIPVGSYTVDITFSNRFQKEMPILLAVPGFDGVRIHTGNTDADTEGCVLVGMEQQSESILRSRDAFNALFPKLQAAKNRGEQIVIEISNP